MKLETKVICEGRTFHVYEDGRGKGFWAVETVFIDKTTHTFRPRDAYHSKTKDEAIEGIVNKVKIENMMAETGMSREQAAMKVIFG